MAPRDAERPATVTRLHRIAHLPAKSVAAFSGLAWAILAYPFAHVVLGAPFWGGFLCSPLIGIFVGRVFHPFENSIPRLFLGSLASVYVAVGLFGLAAGITSWLLLDPSTNQNGPALVVQTLLGCVVGITLTGSVLFFWPLSVLNHWLVHRAKDD